MTLQFFLLPGECSNIYLYLGFWSHEVIYAQIHIWVNVPVHVNLKYVSIHDRHIHVSQYVHKSCQQKSINQQRHLGGCQSTISRDSHVLGILPVEYLTRTMCRQLNIHNFPSPTPPETVESDGLKGSAIKHVIFLVVTVTGWGLNPNNIYGTYCSIHLYGLLECFSELKNIGCLWLTTFIFLFIFGKNKFPRFRFQVLPRKPMVWIGQPLSTNGHHQSWEPIAAGWWRSKSWLAFGCLGDMMMWGVSLVF